MNSGVVIFSMLLYLLIIVGIATYSRKIKSGWRLNYALSLAVYCSAWTYYGSVGSAATDGVGFITIYLGPLIFAPFMFSLLYKIISISKHQHISSLADFLSIRHSNSTSVGFLVAVVSLIAIIPYLSLQIKAISESFQIVTSTAKKEWFFEDFTFYIILFLGLFVSYFGNRSNDTSERNPGIVAAIAFESWVKLIFFITIGIFVTFFVFDGWEDIYQKAKLIDGFHALTQLSEKDGTNWIFTILLSFFAIFLLPRQFHVSVVEYDDFSSFKKAPWIFSLYLLLFNVFVFSIAWGGRVLPVTNVHPDYYVLGIPLQQNQRFLAFIAFIGGFSAATAMIIMSTKALSTMLTNNIIFPVFVKFKNIPREILFSEKSIRSLRIFLTFLIILGSYFYFREFSYKFSLYNIGLIAFVFIAQFAPQVLSSLYWKGGTKKATFWSISAGVFVVFYTLILPYFMGFSTESITEWGWVIEYPMLNPYQLFGIQHLNPIAHATFWSLLVNTSVYFVVSSLTHQSIEEKAQAELYTSIFKYTKADDEIYLAEKKVSMIDLKQLLIRYVGANEAKRYLELFEKKYNYDLKREYADAFLIDSCRKYLSGKIGPVSASVLINTLSDDTNDLGQILYIIQETGEAVKMQKELLQKTKELLNMSKKLRFANEQLVKNDLLKDEFLETIAHEIKTPLTAIRGITEILKENEVEEDEKKQFFIVIENEIDRLTRLVQNLLDSKKWLQNDTLYIESIEANTLISSVINNFREEAKNLGVSINFEFSSNIVLYGDKDRLTQVFTNLLSNAIKFSIHPKIISIKTYLEEKKFIFELSNPSQPLTDDELQLIFTKYYTRKEMNSNGTGLGLTIAKKIVEQHNGTLQAEYNNFSNLIIFTVKIPIEYDK